MRNYLEASAAQCLAARLVGLRCFWWNAPGIPKGYRHKAQGSSCPRATPGWRIQPFWDWKGASDGTLSCLPRLFRPFVRLLPLFSLVALCFCLAIMAGSARAEGRGDEVFVVYNARMPESKEVAEYYARRRQVPPSQVMGVDMSGIEAISRGEYRDRLEKPLLKALKDRELFHFGSQEVRESNGQVRHVGRKVIASKIRYLVLCYGVPLKIGPDAAFKEEVPADLPTPLRRNDAAVDSELSCLPLVEEGYLRLGPRHNPLYGATNAAQLNPTNGILMVARLDGPTASIARGLVDKALDAETNGLWGRAYFDLRGLTSGEYKVGDDQIRSAAEACRRLGFETVVDENGATLPVSFPLSQVALYAGWYDESVSGPFTLPKVEFMPGAFAYHLHSFNAATLRSTTHHWAGALLAKGVTATLGTVEEPYLSGCPNMAAFFPRFIEGFTFGEAAYACQGYLSWQTTVVGDPLYRPFSKSPIQQVSELEQRHSKWLDWACLRVANLGLVNHEPASAIANRLETLPLTRESPVLMEKLADLYEAQGKSESSIAALQNVLKLDPSPQQRIRVMLTLATRLLVLAREPEAYANYQQFVEEFPEYPDRGDILRKLVAMAEKLGKTADAAKYQQEIEHPNAPPLPASKGIPRRPGI